MMREVSHVWTPESKGNAEILKFFLSSYKICLKGFKLFALN